MRTHILTIILLQHYLCKTASPNDVEEPSESIDVKCSLNTSLEENIPNYPQTMNVTMISLELCPPPAVSFASTLAEHNISVSTIRKLFISIQDTRVLMPSEFQTLFQGLLIEELSVESFHQRQHFNSDILDPRDNLYLQSLKVLELTSFVLPPLPATSKFSKITLEFGMSTAELGGCIYLEEITLRKWTVPSADQWLAECKNLHSLNIEYSIPEDVENILHSITNIKHLTMTNCGLYVLPMGIGNLSNLETLDLSHNNIAFIEKPNFFTKLNRLKELILDSNKLSNCKEFSRKPVVLPDLVNLSVANNPFFDLCNKNCYDNRATDMPQSSFWDIPSLKRLNAAHTSTPKLCFGKSTLDALEYLNFTKSDVTFLQFKDLPLSNTTNLKIVDLRDNFIGGLSMGKTEYENLPNGVTVLGVDVTVECDCQNAWLARAVRNKRLSIGAQCHDHTALGDWPADQLECDRYHCDVCICRRAWHDNTTVARCGGGLHALPRLEGVREIHAPGNLITTIGSTELPQSLTFLDLSNNHISRISSVEVEMLFTGGRAVRLAGNPFVCDCEARELVQMFRTHSAQVQDYDEVTCVEYPGTMSQLDPSELCVRPTSYLLLTWGPLLGAVALVAILAAVYFRYKLEIKMFLFVHGCCVWCLHEDDVDSGHLYDAFVSFSHLDDAFVSEHLLPGLEEERRYRLCVHYRDWIAGEWISAQILQSIDLSRRVIIVLSKNFLASSWALLEFRLAEMRSLKEGRCITIVVIIDDVLEAANMNAEIRGHLAMTTYVKWGDPWFWKKLTLALPCRDRDRGGVTETVV